MHLLKIYILYVHYKDFYPGSLLLYWCHLVSTIESHLMKDLKIFLLKFD